MNTQLRLCHTDGRKSVWFTSNREEKNERVPIVVRNGGMMVLLWSGGYIFGGT